MGLTNDSQGVGTADRRSAGLETIRAGGKPGIGNDADLVVENHGLSPGVTHLLDGVEHHVGGHLLVRVVDGDLDSRSMDRNGAGQHLHPGQSVLGLLLSDLARIGPRLQLPRRGTQVSDLGIQLTGGSREGVQHRHQICPAHRRIGVLIVLGMHLSHDHEGAQAQDDGDEDLPGRHRGQVLADLVPVVSGPLPRIVVLRHGAPLAEWRQRW